MKGRDKYVLEQILVLILIETWKWVNYLKDPFSETNLGLKTPYVTIYNKFNNNIFHFFLENQETFLNDRYIILKCIYSTTFSNLFIEKYYTV